MAHLDSLPEEATLFDIARRFPDLMQRMVALNGYIMRGESPLDYATRELLAAYVSGLNACVYCVGSHEAVARAFDVRPEALAELLRDIDSAALADKLKPLFRFARKLTLEPARVTAADAAGVYEAGWDEAALWSTILVCCAFNFMNRLVDGAGLTASRRQAEMSANILFERGYDGVLAAAARSD